MKPDVVLYGEAHKEGERVGEITRKDLLGARPDLLLVVGTSLKVPGTKLLVRELAKVIRRPRKEESEEEDLEPPAASGSTAASVGGTRKRKVKPPPVHSVYLNFDFPTPSREWKDVFDVWVRGDVQEFVGVLGEEKRAEQERVEAKRCEKEAAGKRKEERVKDEKERVEAKESKSTKGKAAAKGKTKCVAGAGAVRKTPVKAVKIVKIVKEKVVKATKSRAPPTKRVAPQPKSGRAGISLLSFPVSKPGPTTRKK